jgi:hypothetical protein
MTQPLAIGTILEVQARDAAPSQFIVAGYDDRAYMQLTKKNDVTVGMCLHPAHALRIATNGGDSGVKVLDGISLADIVVKATEVIVGVPTPSTTVTKTGGESKKMRALRIIAAHPNATRKELIQMFVEQLGMTPAGASTYASMK